MRKLTNVLPLVSRRTAVISLFSLPIGLSLLTLWGESVPTIADDIEVPSDPRVARSCQDFIDMMWLRGAKTRTRNKNSIFVDVRSWQQLAPIERTALANAVAGRAFGKQVRHLTDAQVGFVYAQGSNKTLAIARNTGVTFK